MAFETKKVALPDAAGELIDRTAYEPVYVQLVNILRRQVASGVLRPGDQLPSEAQLCRRYSVSPMTVRRAINILVDQGVVTAEQGRGTFIRSWARPASSCSACKTSSTMSRTPRLGCCRRASSPPMNARPRNCSWRPADA